MQWNNQALLRLPLVRDNVPVHVVDGAVGHEVKPCACHSQIVHQCIGLRISATMHTGADHHAKTQHVFSMRARDIVVRSLPPACPTRAGDARGHWQMPRQTPSGHRLRSASRPPTATSAPVYNTASTLPYLSDIYAFAPDMNNTSCCSILQGHNVLVTSTGIHLPL